MPNWITSEVEITGPKDKIADLVKRTKLKLETEVENEFDFNGLIKLPEELEVTSSPLDIVETEEEAKQKNDEWNKNEFHKRSDGKMQIKSTTGLCRMCKTGLMSVRPHMFLWKT